MILHKKKVFATLILICSFIGLLFSGVFSVSAQTKDDEQYKPGCDTSIYNRDWRKAEVDYWVVYSKRNFWMTDVTTCFMRITDEDGNMLSNLTRLECQYKIGKETFTVNEELKEHKFIDFNLYDKKGHFQTLNNPWVLHYGDTVEGHNYWLFKDSEHPYQKCNYEWNWCWKVTDIIYLYVWYLDPLTGEEVAGSFFPNGEHPKYDENGVLQGIYDLNGVLVSDATLDKDGMIINTSTMEPLLKPEDQCQDSVEDHFNILGPIQGIMNGINSAKTGLDKFVAGVKLVAVILMSLLLLAFVLFVVLKIKKWWKEAR